MTGCLLPALFAAHQGLGSSVHLMPLVVQGHVVPPVSGKALLFEPLANRVDTENFTVQWSDASILEETGVIASEALEEAWTVLVEEEGWGPPHTGDWAKITVLLDPFLGGTGVTTGLVTEDNPMGAPLIYLNPTYVEQPDFFRSVAVHEFGHALQFRFRTWYDAPETEPWYWEATSEWMTEVVNPEWNQYAWSAAWYADAPETDFDSMQDYHQYGMVLLNAYLDAHRGGAETIWSIWMDNENRPWLAEIERVLGEPAIDTWSDFVGAYAAQQLVDSPLYSLPEWAPKTGQIDGHLGSAYIDLGMAEGTLSLSAGVGTLIRDGRWVVFETSTSIPTGSGSVSVVVTNPQTTPLAYAVNVRSNDPDEPGETDQQDPSAEQDQGSSEATNTVGPPQVSTQGCACSGALLRRGTGACVALAVFVLLGFRRRPW